MCTICADLVEFHEEIQRVKDADMYPAVIACNKIDLVGEGEKHRREITSQAVQQWAAQHALSHAPVFETSAKTKVNCREAFESCVRQIRVFRAKEQKKRERMAGNHRKPRSSGGLFGSVSDSKDEAEDLKYI